MFNNYPLKVEYIQNSGKENDKDLFGYTKNADVQIKYIRYVGGKSVEVNESNKYRVEQRLLYHTDFPVNTGDTFIINDIKRNVKNVEKVVDVFGRTVFWEVELL